MRVGGVEILRPGEPLELDERAMRQRRNREYQKLDKMEGDIKDMSATMKDIDTKIEQTEDKIEKVKDKRKKLEKKQTAL